MAQFKNDRYEQRTGVASRGGLWPEDIPLPEASEILNRYFENAISSVERAPQGELHHPYFVPGATYQNLWDWDTLFTVYGAPESAKEYILGSAKVLLEAPLREDGRPVKMASVEGDYSADYVYASHPYPMRAQLSCAASAALQDWSWLKPYYPILCRIMEYYETQCADDEGFFCWMSSSGIDNDPAVYGRLRNTTAGVDLAAFHVREYRAMAAIAGHLKQPEAETFERKAAVLDQLIRTRYYDAADGFFYAVDRSAHRPDAIIHRQFVTWDNHIKHRSCSSLFALWSRSATPEQARSVRNYIMDETEFLAPGGVRSHSKRDSGVYNNALSGNPSNWQGPVWGLITPLAAYSLNAYGYHDDAVEIAGRIVRTMARDLKQNGCLHECYHGDTGQPILKPGFLSFNLMTYHLLENLASGKDPTQAGMDSKEEDFLI